jgi:ubiquinone/menaquinone biosynthesis C-methylase UbiE
MLPRTLEPEVMDTEQEARDYDAMDHGDVNRAFVDGFLAAAEKCEFADRVRSSTEPLDVLDVGTGTALIPIELCRRPVCCRVTAVDLSREMLKVAARNVSEAGLGERIDVERVDGKSLPFADRSWSAVMSNSIVHHIPDPRTALGEMVRVLRPGGCLFVRDLLRPESIQRVDDLVAAYAGDANTHQRQMFRDSLCAALTLDEVRVILCALSMPPDWIRRTSDRHWTISGVL